MKIYLAGPMRGIVDFNFPAFDEAAARGRALGHEIISPAEMDREVGFNEKTDADKVTDDFMRDAVWRDCFAILGEPGNPPSGVEAVAMLPGWENSRGAKGEKYIAEWVGLKILDARTFEPLAASTNPKDRVGRLKPSLHLIPAAAQIIESRVMELGASKYGPYNWRDKQVAATVYVAAALRHILSFLDGEDDDPESGVSHLGHARACMGILLDAQALGKLHDDRPTKGVAAKLITRYTKQA